MTEIIFVAILISPIVFVLFILEIHFLISKSECKKVNKYLRSIGSKLSAYVNPDGDITIDEKYYWKILDFDYKTIAQNILLMDQIKLGMLNADKSLDFLQIWRQIMGVDGLTYINNFEEKKEEIRQYFKTEKYNDDLIDYYLSAKKYNDRWKNPSR